MGTSELCWMSAVELAAAIQTRRLSPVEITRATEPASVGESHGNGPASGQR